MAARFSSTTISAVEIIAVPVAPDLPAYSINAFNFVESGFVIIGKCQVIPLCKYLENLVGQVVSAASYLTNAERNRF